MTMVRSMTGYGRFEGVINGRQTVFEIKSVNHRFFELQCRLPRGCGFLEEPIKNLVSRYVSRGKTDVYVSVEADDSQEAEVRVNHSLAAGYVKALRQLCEEYELQDDISASLLSRIPDLFTVSKAPENEETLAAIVTEAGEKALADFMAMREKEGERLAGDLLDHGQRILALVDEIEERYVGFHTVMENFWNNSEKDAA